MASAAVGVVGKIVSFGLSSSAASKRRRAARLQRRITRIRNRQARRQFLKNFRRRQAELLLEGSREGGFESSRFQGTRASLQTTGDVFLSEQEEQTRLGRRAGSALDSASRNEQVAGVFGGIANAAGSFK